EFVHRVPSSEVYIQNRRLYDMCGEKIGAKLLTDVNQELRKTTQGLFLNQLDSIGFPTEKIRHVDPEWVWRRFKYVFCNPIDTYVTLADGQRTGIENVETGDLLKGVGMKNEVVGFSKRQVNSLAKIE